VLSVTGGYSPRLAPPSTTTQDKETLMKYSVLGATGVKVSRICLGTATFGVAPTAQDADRVVGAAIDAGINFVRHRRHVRQHAGLRPARRPGRRRP
jgi:hypothetical protein